MSPVLDRQDIERILPHRDPFLFVDEVVELAVGRRVVGVVRTPETGFFLRGVPSDARYFPPTLLIEAMAQVGAILVLHSKENQGRTIYFRSIEEAQFHENVPAGATLRIEGDVRRLRGRMGTLAMKAFLVDAPGALLAEGVMSFAL
ncbi:MAG TPA: 3-hydroxyacyl-[acyl-carrier-protein] dehydratase FabZ [Vicinamibacteria bacterium]